VLGKAFGIKRKRRKLHVGELLVTCSLLIVNSARVIKLTRLR
jgi:hypothetical protein